MRFKYTKVDCRYGAPMGRPSDVGSDKRIKFRLQRVLMVSGDYDPGGAYWGGCRGVLPLWCARGDGETEMVEMFTRAASREEAKCGVRERFPNAVFYK